MFKREYMRNELWAERKRQQSLGQTVHCQSQSVVLWSGWLGCQPVRLHMGKRNKHHSFTHWVLLSLTISILCYFYVIVKIPVWSTRTWAQIYAQLYAIYIRERNVLDTGILVLEELTVFFLPKPINSRTILTLSYKTHRTATSVLSEVLRRDFCHFQLLISTSPWETRSDSSRVAWTLLCLSLAADWSPPLSSPALSATQCGSASVWGGACCYPVAGSGTKWVWSIQGGKEQKPMQAMCPGHILQLSILYNTDRKSHIWLLLNWPRS